MNEIMEMVLDVSGSVLRQAEWEGDYNKTYTRVFEKIMQLQFMENVEVLEVLGNLGG